MKTTTILLLLSFFILAGCQPSAQSIETAIAETQIVAGLTQVALPTSTSRPTETPIPTATQTFTPTVLPTATPDLRVIDIDPRKLLLQKEDLPPIGRYYLPNELWMSPLTNSEIISSWTVEEGQAYLAETGRIHGWEVAYNRGASGSLMPQEVYHNVVVYSSVEGPQIVVDKYARRNIEDGFKVIDAPQVGDSTHAYERSETDASGATRVSLRLEFTYQNLYHGIVLWGWENEVSVDFAVQVANSLLEKTSSFPLSNSVTFMP